MQQPRQFRITKRDVLSWLLLGECMDHSAERQQGLIDFPSFFGPLAGSPGMLDAFGTRQIDEIQGRNQHSAIGFFPCT